MKEENDVYHPETRDAEKRNGGLNRSDRNKHKRTPNQERNRAALNNTLLLNEVLLTDQKQQQHACPKMFSFRKGISAWRNHSSARRKHASTWRKDASAFRKTSSTWHASQFSLTTTTTTPRWSGFTMHLTAALLFLVCSSLIFELKADSPVIQRVTGKYSVQ